MSSAVFSTSAAPGRPFLFDDESSAHVGTAAIGCPVERSSTIGQQHLLSTIKSPKFPAAGITAASRLEIRPAPELVSSGIPALDALTGGLPRGCLTEICGPASSGRTSVMLAVLAAATRRGEYCAVIDANDTLDPQSLATSGIDLDRLLWIRCSDQSPALGSAGLRPAAAGASCPRLKSNPNSGQLPGSSSATTQPAFDFPDGAKQKVSCQSEHRLEQILRATDLLLESGGFGLIILDLADVPHQAARRIPLTTWFRFRRAVEHKPTILLAIEQHPIAGSCSSLVLQLQAAKRRKNAAHACPEQSRRGASRGWSTENDQAPVGRKTFCETGEAPLDLAFPSHAHLLTKLEIHAELIRSRLDRKPARSIAFETKTSWAG